jgi:signal transduction histidine kinase
MYYVLAFFVGLIVGAICLSLYLWLWYQSVKERESQAQTKANAAVQSLEEAKSKQNELNQLSASFAAQRQEFERRIISYRDLQQENHILKHDLQNIDVNLNKLDLDGELRDQKQKEIDQKSNELAKRYLNETVKSVVDSIGPSNFSACKKRLIEVICRCREIGFAVSTDEEAKLLAGLRVEFEKAVRAAFQREEQARIKAQIREEERLRRELEREKQQAERERIAIQAALDKALAEAAGQHTVEVDALKTRLAEAEAKLQRTISMAQQTKAGHVYVISNIGSFGENVFKVGMTRRLEPRERIDELGCASVPFPFDIHMMIHSTDAPSLENALHRSLFKKRINKANPRKEFFRAQVQEICDIVKAHGGQVDFVMNPEAAEYRQSLNMPDEDAQFIEQVYDTTEEEEGVGVTDD